MMDSDLPSGTDMSSLNESSLNDTLQMTQCDVTMDDDALEMLQILKELERSVEEGKEDDCILSQVVKENEDEEDEKEVDMTLPLESIITPKNSPRHDAFSDGIENMDLDTTIIPQLDGQALDSDKETPSNVKLAVLEKDLGSIQRKGRFSKNKFIPKAFYIKLIDCRCANKSMPLLDEYCNSNDPKDKRIGKLSPIQLEKDTNCQKEIPRLPSTSGLDDKKSVNGRKNVVIRNFRRGGNTVKRSESKHVYEKWNNVKCNLTPAEEEVRVFEMRLKKINRKDDVSLLMKKIRKKDKEMALLLTRDCHPVFNVFPNNKKSRKRQYLSLDGIIDSSDDENCDKQIKPKRSFIRTKSDDNSRYSALPISISQTCRSEIEDEGLLQNIDNRHSSEYCLPNLEEAKRKLNFHYSNNGVNNTVIEERLDCIYSPVRRKTIKPKPLNLQSLKLKMGKEKKCNFETNNHGIEDAEDYKEDYNSDFSSEQDISSSSASCDDEALNTSFFSKLKPENDKAIKRKKCKRSEEIISYKEQHLSAAARYDTETNFKAKEGCSTVFTPPISQKLTQSSNDSKIAMLTPYQAPTSVADDENSSDEKILIYEPLQKAPSRKEVLESLDALNIPHIKFEEPYYSNWEDVTGSIEVGYNVLMIKSKSIVNLPEFESQKDALNNFRRHRLGDQLQKKTNLNKMLLSYCKPGDVIITPVKKPPTFKMVVDWMNQRDEVKHTPIRAKPEKIKLHLRRVNSPTFSNVCKRRKTEIREKLLGKSLSSQNSQHGRSCEITGLTASASLDFDKSVENLKGARAVLEHQNLALLVMELHVKTRGEFKPDPAFDPIDAIFYSVLNDVPENSGKVPKCRGAIVVNALPACSAGNQYPILNGIGIDCDITYVNSEQELLEEFLKFVERCDPDIVAGYEIQMLSWGYLIDRGNTVGINLKSELGRSKSGALVRKDDESSKDLKLVGRIVLDVWRIMRHEIAIQSYTFESIVYHILQKRVPCYSFKDLTFWWSHKSNLYRHRTASYYLYRVLTILDLFDKLDLIGRTSELARLFGIQFYEVMSRGSQFRVESMMLRLAKPLNFIP
ncbi:unnamed protein product, partial [Callosobruchus maculatus]